jgi:hypothetical protein
MKNIKIYVAVEFEIEVPKDAKEVSHDGEKTIDRHIGEKLLSCIPDSLNYIDYMWDYKENLLQF